MGIEEIMQDPVRFQYLTRPFSAEQLARSYKIPRAY
jgi:hypothetical protein